MKKKILLLLLVPACAFAGANVTFNLTDFLGSVDTLKRKTMTVQPLSTVRANGTNVVVSERRFYNTGTNAIVTITNMTEGIYRVTVWGGNYTSVFGIRIPDTNGTITASDHLTSLVSGALELDDGRILLLDE